MPDFDYTRYSLFFHRAKVELRGRPKMVTCCNEKICVRVKSPLYDADPLYRLISNLLVKSYESGKRRELFDKQQDAIEIPPLGKVQFGPIVLDSLNSPN